jgi:hypothetical protein
LNKKKKAKIRTTKLNNKPRVFKSYVMGSMGGVAVRALTSHHCDPGSIPRLALRVFLRVLRFSSLHKNQHSFNLSCVP